MCLNAFILTSKDKLFKTLLKNRELIHCIVMEKTRYLSLVARQVPQASPQPAQSAPQLVENPAAADVP